MTRSSSSGVRIVLELRHHAAEVVDDPRPTRRRSSWRRSAPPGARWPASKTSRVYAASAYRSRSRHPAAGGGDDGKRKQMALHDIQLPGRAKVFKAGDAPRRVLVTVTMTNRPDGRLTSPTPGATRSAHAQYTIGGPRQTRHADGVRQRTPHARIGVTMVAAAVTTTFATAPRNPPLSVPFLQLGLHQHPDHRRRHRLGHHPVIAGAKLRRHVERRISKLENSAA